MTGHPAAFARRTPGRVLRLAVGALVAGLAMGTAIIEGDEPDYPHGSFREDCALCHVATAWAPARPSGAFDHAARGFPLLGAHSRAACRACHATLDFAAAPGVCVGCHLDPHQTELGTDCERCHSALSFIDRGPMIRTHRTTRFPLSGSHRVTDCESCHPVAAQGKLRYVNTPVDCESCHLAEYLATTDPDHEAASFPRDCALCHTTVVWNRARFDHAGTSFPLTGAHATLDCEQCHSTSYTGTPTACEACHMDDYLATTDPDHQAAGLPTNCALCHTPSSWENAQDLQHDALYFPIYSGKHQGKWSTCSECHTSPSSFASFNCLQCHAHDDPTDLAGKHSGISGYTYNSQACYTCHPRGDS